MHTNHVNILLPDYVRGKLEGGENDLVEAHLRECSECHWEAERVRELFRTLQESTRQNAPVHYFSRLVPRVRERLSRGGSTSWWQRPLFERVALPLAAAIVAVAVLARIPLELQQDNGRNISGLYEPLNPAEVADVFTQQGIPLLNTMAVQELAEVTVPARVLDRQIAEHLVAYSSSLSLDDFSEISTDQLLGDLNDEELETLLARLGERIML